MRKGAVEFGYARLTVRAVEERAGEVWRGQLLNERGELEDEFAYVREGFPGAVIGAMRVADVAFAPRLAAQMWLHTEPETQARALISQVLEGA